MEAIGRQVRLPVRTAVQISLQGIRIRLGRALVTISGVVLGIAFLMNVLAGSLISSTVAEEQEQRMKVDMMLSLVRAKIGDPQAQIIAVVGVGTLDQHEAAALQTLNRRRAVVRGYNIRVPGVEAKGDLLSLTDQADIVLVMGNGENCEFTSEALTATTRSKEVLDSLDARLYAGQPFVASGIIKRELFFGKRMEAEQIRIEQRKEQARFRTIWIVTISLLVTIIGIANALLMSVTERFKEIGTMKCLGALSGFIRQLFLIESAVIGVVGSVVGILIGIIFPMLMYSFAFGFNTVWGSISYSELGVYSIACLFAGTILSIVAAIYPATIAARMIPAMALRTNV